MVHPEKILPTGGVEAYSLSSLQHGMLFHALKGVSDVDLQQVVCETPEVLDPAAFAQAWRDTVARHEALRVSFAWNGAGEPSQRVQPADAAARALEVRALQGGCGEAECRASLEAYLAEDRRRGFASLAAAPLLRVAFLTETSAEAPRSWWVATYHHILLDARSMVPLFRDVMERYDALASGRAVEPVRGAGAYGAVATWRQSLDHEHSEFFWREYLRGFSTPTVVPVARAVAEAAGEAGAADQVDALSEETTDGLRRTADRHAVTVNTLVQAAWALVLSRYSGETEVVFGALRACRHVPVEGASEMVGLFINTVPVRARMDDAETIGAWLTGLRRQWIALREHEHTPLNRVQAWSEIPAGRALFDTLLNYQETPWDSALRSLGGRWAQRRFEIRSRTGYPLAIDVYGGAALTLRVFFERSRFEPATVARLLGHFRTVLEALAADSCQTVGQLPLLTASEREEILVGWNRTEATYPRYTCAHLEFERRVELAPERIAVTDENTTLTYRELNVRANRVARLLRDLGVGPDTLAAVCMERSVEMIVAWLGVLKAGGAFVPLDPSYPRERLAFQLSDCAAPVLLTQPGLRERLDMVPPEVTVVVVPADGSGFELESDRGLVPLSTANNLAYVIYTSGSTGQPKGVQIEHRALMNLVTWHQQLYHVAPADRATHLASPAFDASVWEIWPYLAAGASVHIPGDETRLSPAALWRWMAEKEITLSFMPTPLAEAAMAEFTGGRLALRALLTGGDKLKRRAPADFPCTLVNHYGPTESTVVATCIPVEADAVDATSAPTIGRPIANTTVYVLDRALRPVPVGVPGELFIGGESLARGYLNRPELTAERFVQVSLEGAPAARLYRTGDLVRWTEDGRIEFLGRLDGQVKIRGHRIELGEIEATLQSHPGIRESVVLVRPNERGEPELVAYALAQPGAELAETEALVFLRSKLPAYMIPSALLLLEAWPLTPNGKIDRRALPAPALRSAASGTAAAAPRTQTEQAVARIWSDVLGRTQVGREDNFFDLGGHSLLAAQVISRLGAVVSAPISVRVLFDRPTLGAFAAELDRTAAERSPARPPLQRIQRRSTRTELELVQPT